MNILVVDDILLTRKMVRLAVEPLEIGVYEAQDGIEALNILQEKSDIIDLIFLDWNMPNMDGYEFLNRIKANDRYRDIPVIMTTTKNERENIIKAIKAGAVQYMVKPFKQEDVITKIMERTDTNLFMGNLLFNAIYKLLGEKTGLEVSVKSRTGVFEDQEYDLFAQVLYSGEKKMLLSLALTAEDAAHLSTAILGKDSTGLDQEKILAEISQFTREVSKKVLSYGEKTSWLEVLHFIAYVSNKILIIDEKALPIRTKKYQAGRITLTATLYTLE